MHRTEGRGVEVAAPRRLGHGWPVPLRRLSVGCAWLLRSGPCLAALQVLPVSQRVTWLCYQLAGGGGGGSLVVFAAVPLLVPLLVADCWRYSHPLTAPLADTSAVIAASDCSTSAV